MQTKVNTSPLETFFSSPHHSPHLFTRTEFVVLLIIQALHKGGTTQNVSGDGTFDSPGWSAMFCTYLTMVRIQAPHLYRRNQSGCQKAKKVAFLPFILWVFLTIYIFVALMKITMCLKQLEVSHIMSWDS